MSAAVETALSTMPLPNPIHFSHAEQSFSLKKRRPPLLSSSSASTSSASSPSRLAHSLPPFPPTKSCPCVRRTFSQPCSPWTPLSRSLSPSLSPSSPYDPSSPASYFEQCFTTLGLLGRGSFGEVFKVLSHEDGRQYAVKRSAHRFRGNNERNQFVREARNHERVCPHPHIVDFVAAWEESGRVYIQTELCSSSLLLHAENQPAGPDEPGAWAYLCDLLSALEHLHSAGFVHLDLKTANVLVTDSGRLKLGDFGLMLELRETSAAEGKVKEDHQEGDGRYMAPELLRGEWGPPADVFSLGISILELACNMEVPNGGEGWQQLRQGRLPSEFTNALSPELQRVLRMMLAPDPLQRATVCELLALPSVRKHGLRRRRYLRLKEMLLSLASLCQAVVSCGWRFLSSLCAPFLPRWSLPNPSTPPRDTWEKDLTLPLSAMHVDSSSPDDDAVFLPQEVGPRDLSPTFLHSRIKSRLPVDGTSTPLPASPSHSRCSPARTPAHSDWPSRHLTFTPSSLRSNASPHSSTPLTDCSTDARNTSGLSGRSVPSQSSRQSGRRWMRSEDAVPRSNLEPKNLLSLFDGRP